MLVNLAAGPVVGHYLANWLGLDLSWWQLVWFTLVTVAAARLPDQIECFRLLGHRTWSHSLLLFTGMCWGAGMLNHSCSLGYELTILGLITGFGLHLAADMFSKQGITLVGLGPRIRFGVYTTGKFSEVVIAGLVFAGFLVWGIWLWWLHSQKVLGQT